jgi:hypothetical protein
VVLPHGAWIKSIQRGSYAFADMPEFNPGWVADVLRDHARAIGLKLLQ